MNRAESQRLIRGTIVTMPTAFDDDFKLDLATTTEMTHWWVEQGLGTETTPLKVAATEESLRNTGDKEADDRTIGSMSSPDGVAAVLAFLASDDASYIRGSIRTI